MIPKAWRRIATMNVFDKSPLSEMSYALMRRFAPIKVTTGRTASIVLGSVARPRRFFCSRRRWLVPRLGFPSRPA